MVELDRWGYWIRQAIAIARDAGNRDTARRADEELAALRARVAALEDGIRTYGGHFDYCNATRGFTDPKCNCGLRELLKPQPVPRQEPVR